MKTVLITAVAALSVLPLAAQQFRPERFAPIPPSVGSNWLEDVATGDIDGDGFDDVVLALDRAGVVHLRSDGNGGFVDVTTPALHPPSSRSRGVALDDVDGDGDLDLAVAAGPTPVRILLNQGGTFVDATATWSMQPDGFADGVVWLDADGDGALDLYVLQVAGDRLLRQSNGRLVDVTERSLPASFRLHGRTAWSVDIDADGDVDVVPQDAFANGLLVNDGTGHFTNLPNSAFPVFGANVLGAGDFDGNGRVDLVTTYGSSAMPSLWLQRPDGTFADVTATNFPSLPSLETSVSIDVDLDGDLDLCSPTRLLVNNGEGNFVDVSSVRWTPLSDGNTQAKYAYTAADFDGDGDPDFVFADAASSQLVSVNHHRQVSAPVAPVIGASYPLDFELAAAYTTTEGITVPWFAAGPANLATPLGRLGVDPSTIVAGPTVALPWPAGRGRLELRIPDRPALIGATFYCQAVLIQPSGIALSNTIRDRIR